MIPIQDSNAYQGRRTAHCDTRPIRSTFRRVALDACWSLRASADNSRLRARARPGRLQSVVPRRLLARSFRGGLSDSPRVHQTWVAAEKPHPTSVHADGKTATGV